MLQTPGIALLQISAVQNLAAPSYNQESNAHPRLLLFRVTDGKSRFNCLELQPIAGLRCVASKHDCAFTL